MTCRICTAIDETPDLPNTQLALQQNTSETSIRRHRKARHNDPVRYDEFFENVPSEAITSRGRSIRTESGSWEKVTYNPHKVAQIETQRLAYDDLNHLLTPYQPPAPSGNNRVLYVCAADLQVGKTGSGGGTKETLERAHSCMSQAVDHAQRHDYDEIVFVDLGDSVENFQNVTAQAQTNDLSLTDQVRTVRRFYMECIRTLAPLTPRLTYVAVPSNHCAVRSGQGDKNRSNAPDDDYGLLIQDSIEDAFSLLPTHNVSFVKPSKWEESVVHNGVGFSHGHLSKTPNGTEQWLKNQMAGKISGLDNIFLFVHGHYHHLRLLEVANGVLILGAPTLDPGSDYYANSSGNRANPGMLVFDTEGNHLKGWHVYRPEGKKNGEHTPK